MQLPIDTVIQPKFTQHQLQRALYSLWQARCRDCKIPCGSLSPARRLAPTYLPPVSLAWPRRTAVSFVSPARK